MSAKELLEKTSNGLEVFRKYVPYSFKINKTFSSPLREDKNPSFCIYLDKITETYKFKDFAQDHKGDAIEFTKLMFGISFTDACDKIANDFNLSLHEKFQRISPSIVPVVNRGFAPWELAFWKRYGIEEDLLIKYRVVPHEDSKADALTFAYQFSWGRKVYRPNSDQRFFYEGKSDFYIFGFDQLKDKGLYLLLAAGEKDTLSLSAKGYNAICFNSETKDIPRDFFRSLKKRFKYILICYDADKAGQDATKKHLKEHPDLIEVTLPLTGTKDDKDVSDFFKVGNNRNDFDEIIKESIHRHFLSVLKELSSNKFDFDKDVPEPISVFQIEENKILTLGNIAVLAGKVKSGKSAVCQSLITGSIQQGEFGNKANLGIDVVPNQHKLAVLHFDTEQSTFDYTHKIRRCIKDAGFNSNVDYFHSFHLLEFSPWERLRYIEHMVDYYSIAHGGIYLILIDGVADLVKSVNDEENCNEVVNLLHKIATEHNCGILVILHLNPDGFKTRGHLGSQLDRKAESVLVVEKEGDSCTINPKWCRNASFSNISLPQFEWDAPCGKFVFIGHKGPETRVDKRKAECEDILEEAKENKITWLRQDLRKFICEQSGISRTSAYDWINFMIQQSLLEELQDGKLKITQL